ncbi:MAG: hypothetical protein KatS3mg042_0501 [Rhodothermaceae bacterium]|nr:MAG: hypothetical protein KatS3mg042_0501 [Rhodothermaceae bacterium]
MESEPLQDAPERTAARLRVAPDVQRRLRQRAARLARRPEPERQARREVFTFRLGAAVYGVDLAGVSEVVRSVTVTPIPCTPAFVGGVFNHHGRIFSVIDLPVFWGIGRSSWTPDEPAAIVLVRHDGMEVGLRADAIEGTEDLAVRELQPPPPTLSPAVARCLIGVTERLYVLDIPALLTAEGLRVQDEPRH